MRSVLSSTATLSSAPAAANLPAQIAARAQAGRVSPFWVWAMLPARTLLFLAVGLLMVGVFALLLLPLTNSAVELTTYMGYALPRLEVMLKRQWPAIGLAALSLSLQHIAFPLIFAPDWVLWCAFSFLPLGLVVALAYVSLRRLPPLLVVHFVMDLQMAASVLLASLA